MRKSILLITIILLLTLGSKAQFAGGNGSAKNPFQVATAAQLDEVRNYMGSVYNFVMIADIDLTIYLKSGDGYTKWGASGWLPLGGLDNHFEGKFNGNGHIISGLWINRKDDGIVGLFGFIDENGIVNNLEIIMSSTNLIKGKNDVGGVCGHLYRGTISNCHFTGDIFGEDCIGGIAGINSRGIILECSANTDVVGDTCVGSITGYVYYATVLNSCSEGTVIGNNYVGGLTGSCKSGTIRNCYTHADVSQTGNTESRFGGFAGYNNSGEIVNCYSTGWVKYDGITQTNKGFLGGVNTGTGYEMSGNFWDTTTSGATTSSGIATAKSTSQMTTGALTYPNIYINADWDFKGTGAEDIWNIGNGRNDGYPYFDWQYSSDPAFALFAGGDGTSGDPFEIKTAAHLNNVRNYLGSVHSDKHFILVNDIDLTTYLTTGGEGFTEWGAEGWLPIGDFDNRFNGKLDGNNQIINGLWINRPEDLYVGLFGIIDLQGEIIDLGVEVSEGEIVDGSEDVGILAGVNSGSVHYCYATGEVNGNGYIGGLIGFCETGSTTEGCSFSGLVTGIGSVGGLAGAVYYGIAEKCYSTGEVYGEFNTGGLIGSIKSGTIRNSYSLINIILTSNEFPSVGGFIGKNEKGSISKCYSTGRVTFGTEILLNKGFCGSLDPSGDDYEMSGNFWDIQTSGASSTGGEVDEYATGKTTLGMKQQSSFIGWDFGSIWSIVSEGDTLSYPFLTNNAQIPAPGLETLFAGGDGSEGDPYQISTPAHLNNVRNYLGILHIDKHFQLMNDIDLTEYLATGDGFNAWGTKGWLPISDCTDIGFEGKFNGGGNKITGLWINRPEMSCVGLFGKTGEEASISNLDVETDETSFILGNETVAIVVAANNGTIENCSAKGDVQSIATTISYTGEIAGSNGGNIRFCYALGTVKGEIWTGGFVGYNWFWGSINNCYAHVNVTRSSESADTIIGAFVGMNYGGKINNCYSTGWVKYGEVIQSNKGFAGEVDPSGDDYEMTGNFWDTETSGASSTGGSLNEFASGKTTFEMKKQSTFTGWDFPATWSMLFSGGVISYPYLTNNAQNPAPGRDQLFSAGNGDSEKPFRITTPKQLNNVRYFIGSDYDGVFFELYNDIDLTDYLASGEGYTKWGQYGWLPIGTFIAFDVTQRFCGKFNGGGNKITGLWINRSGTNSIGLFGCTGEGGLIEEMGVEICDTSFVSGNNYVGGLVGCHQLNATISKCYSSGLIKGLNQTGGLVGDNYGTIEDSYVNANVTRISGGGICFGGFSGTNYRGKIINCYSKGWVKESSGSPFAGKGFCGSIEESEDFEMSGNFWDIQTSGSTTSACNATGKTTAEMKTYSTFFDAGWDFMDETENGKEDIWGINHENNSGYPFLSWQGYTNIPAHVNIGIEKTTSSIQIDGVEESIWDLVEPVPISKNYIGETPTVDAYWKALWCDSGIYVLLNVQDDNHWPAWEAGEDQIWDYDWTNVFFDVNDTLIDGRGTKDFGKGHYQTYIPFTEEGYDTPVLNSLPDALTPGGSYAYSLTSENYVIEHFFPFDNFVNINGDTLNKNSFLALGEIGFDVTITDQDEGVTTSRQRKVWQSDGSIDEAWNNMDGCGTITLIEQTQDNLQLANLNLTDGQIECFNAFDTIIVAGDGNPVEFLSGSFAELIAGQSIRFLPGFHAFEGSFMNASITTDGTFCDGASGSIVQNPQPEKSGNANKIIIPEQGVSKEVKLYPNPNKGDFSVEVSNMGEGAEIRVYNALGINVYKTLLRENLQRINLENVRPGFYIVKVSDGKDQFVKKVIIE